MKKFIIEFGMGMDFHGQDVTKAASKAVRDAVSRSCLCGLEDLIKCGNSEDNILVKAVVAVSRPEEVNCEEVAKMLPVGRKEVIPVKGGLCEDGLCIREFGDSDASIEAALAAVSVYMSVNP